MSEIQGKINYFILKLGQVREAEKSLKDLSQKDEARVSEIKKADLYLKMKDGELAEELTEWFKEIGIKNNTHLVEFIDFFWKKRGVDLS